jgi:hypothetical protein
VSRNAFPAQFFGTDFSAESAAFSGTIPTSKIQRATRTENAPRGAAFCATKIDAPTRRTRPLSAPPNRAHIGADSVRRKRVVLATPDAAFPTPEERRNRTGNPFETGTRECP